MDPTLYEDGSNAELEAFCVTNGVRGICMEGHNWCERHVHDGHAVMCMILWHVWCDAQCMV